MGVLIAIVAVIGLAVFGWRTYSKSTNQKQLDSQEQPQMGDLTLEESHNNNNNMDDDKMVDDDEYPQGPPLVEAQQA